MAQQQVFGIKALSCYTVDSSDESDDEPDQEKRVEDFGDLCIKQEPTDADEEMTPGWQVDKEGYKDPTETETIAISSEFLQPQDIKVEIESEDDSSSSSSSSDSDSDSETDAPDPSVKVKEEDEADKPENSGPIKTANELLTKDLPPIEEVSMTVQAHECKEVGNIKNLVEEVALWKTLPNYLKESTPHICFHI